MLSGQSSFSQLCELGYVFSLLLMSFFPPPVAQQPNGVGRLIVDVAISHTIRHTHTHSRTPLNE
jgi:hypothetical protein